MNGERNKEGEVGVRFEVRVVKQHRRKMNREGEREGGREGVSSGRTGLGEAAE